MKHTFQIPGEPVGKARPRVTSKGTYTPKKTKEYEVKVRECYDGPKFEGAVSMYVFARLKIPKSYTKKKKAELLGKPVMKKPDYDNIEKIITDALNGIAFDDDAQVTDAAIQKRYVLFEDDEPYVYVVFEDVEE